MESHFDDFAHLDPSRDSPEPYWAAFDLLSEVWSRLHIFQSSCPPDDFLAVLITRLVSQLVAAGLVLLIS